MDFGVFLLGWKRRLFLDGMGWRYLVQVRIYCTVQPGIVLDTLWLSIYDERYDMIL